MNPAPFDRSSLHEKIAVVLRDEIRVLEPGRKLDSESTLAKRFSVSRMTARVALEMLVQEGLVRRRHGSGTYVLDQQDSKRVGLLIELDLSFPNISMFYPRVVQRLRHLFHEHGYREKLYVGHIPPGSPRPHRLTCREFLDDARKGIFCGVAAVSTVPLAEWMDVLKARGVPVVGPAVDFDYGVGACDNLVMLREGVRRLLALGCHNIFSIFLAKTGELDESDPTAQEFRRVLQTTPGVTGDFLQLPATARSNHTWQAFQTAWRRMKNKPDGLLVMDDILFQSLTPAILELGLRVPDQLKVVTHVNKGAGMIIPFPVTCLETDPDEYAETTAQMLLCLMKKEPVPQPKVMLPFRCLEVASSRAEIGVTP